MGEPAREKRSGNAGIQTARVIVDDHRGQARSHRYLRCLQILHAPTEPVGASPAREKPEGAAGCQTVRVIVDDHREQTERRQTRSHQKERVVRSAGFFQFLQT